MYEKNTVFLGGFERRVVDLNILIEMVRPRKILWTNYLILKVPGR